MCDLTVLLCERITWLTTTRTSYHSSVCFNKCFNARRHHYEMQMMVVTAPQTFLPWDSSFFRSFQRKEDLQGFCLQRRYTSSAFLFSSYFLTFPTLFSTLRPSLFPFASSFDFSWFFCFFSFSRPPTLKCRHMKRWLGNTAGKWVQMQPYVILQLCQAVAVNEFWNDFEYCICVGGSHIHCEFFCLHLLQPLAVHWHLLPTELWTLQMFFMRRTLTSVASLVF